MDAFRQLLVLLAESSICGDLVGREVGRSSRSLHRASERPDPRTLILCQEWACHEPPGAFSGPHRKSIPMDDCENILMAAGGFGIAAHLPYLKQLIHGYNDREVRARRIHLVWQVRDIGKL